MSEKIHSAVPSLTRQSVLAGLLLAGLVLSSCDVFGGSEEDNSEESEEPVSLYSQEEIDYYLEIAIGSEYGSPTVVKKWTQPLRIEVGGDPTEEDSASLNRVVRDLNELTDESPQLTLVEERGNVEVLFVPVDSMSNYNENYQPGNLGYFYIWWNGQYQIQRAQVLIGSERTTQVQRSHLIREELTQSLGLMNDSPQYDLSIFQIDYSEVRSFTDLDQTVIRMHYRAEVRPGMDREVAKSVLESITPPS